ncbi:divergent polysaccharide deacetylase family protein [Thermosulfurimonas marina]|uniref:Divergent polysaccharide deacetylase family protein n=2 Tax=Thermosulfurimonas marina TaxID=2047767 RepID=A0A6H1WQC2_9BACT|nr:divergent polysaccharide deacetylase family protein [Thermosulfurimonas marina]
MGQRPRLERAFFKLGLRLNFSFLPKAPFTARLAREAHERGFTVLVHLPMEAENGINPGPEALLVSMGEKEIRLKTQQLIALVPFAEGVNQHMGSLFSQDPLRMNWVMQEIKNKGMFFVDSKTTPHSVAPFVAEYLKIPFAQRDVFLDNNFKKEALENEFKHMLKRAREKGRLVVIAHPHPQTLELLRRHRQELLSEVRLVSIKDLVEVPP